MEDFKTYVENATEKGTNGVPGAVMAVVDSAGKLSIPTCYGTYSQVC
jgi:hypothetical protein